MSNIGKILIGWAAFLVSLLVAFFLVSESRFILHVFGFSLIMGLGISVLTLRRVSKSENLTKPKTYFNFVFNLFLFGLIGYAIFISDLFYDLSIDLGYLFIILPGIIFTWAVAFTIGFWLTIKNKEKKESLLNLRKLSRTYTFLVVIVVALHLIISGGMILLNRLSPPDTPYEVVERGYDCDDFWSGGLELSDCYSIEAHKSGDADICLKGIKNSLPGMEDCIINAAETSKDSSICGYFTDETFFGYEGIAAEMQYGRCLRAVR